jgi:transcriptional regulator with XRE-family HTH domain
MNFNFHILDEARQNKGISIREVCEELKINPSTWHRWMNNDVKPKLETIMKACNYLGININDLIN